MGAGAFTSLIDIEGIHHDEFNYAEPLPAAGLFTRSAVGMRRQRAGDAS